MNRRPYIPRSYQRIGTEFILDTPRCALWAGMGMGKGVMALTAIDTRYMAGITSKPTLVLGPLRVARDVWPDEAAKWHHLHEIVVSPIVGSEKQRLAALRKDASVYTTNYEQLPWLIAHLGKDWPFETVVSDESTRLKGFRLTQGGIRAQMAARVAHAHTKYWINLTGTPAPNGLRDLWGQTWFLDQGERLGLSYSAFMSRWFVKGYDGFSVKPMNHAADEIYAKLKDLCLTLDPKDWFDLEEPVVTEIKVKLPPNAMKTYKQFEKSMFAELACGTELEVFNAAALTNKCLQLANGFVYHDGAVKAMHNAKIEALESVLEEANGPVLVGYNFIEDAHMILKAFPRAAELRTTEGMKRFKAGDAPIGIAHPKSMGHGVDGLQNVCNTLVRYGHGWDAEERLQMLERIGPVRQMQAGLDRPVLVYDLISTGTIDETVIARHTTKIGVQEALLNAMKVTR